MEFPSEDLVQSYINSLTDMDQWQEECTKWVLQNNDNEKLLDGNQMFFIEHKKLKIHDDTSINVVVS